LVGKEWRPKREGEVGLHHERKRTKLGGGVSVGNCWKRKPKKAFWGEVEPTKETESKKEMGWGTCPVLGEGVWGGASGDVSKQKGHAGVDLVKGGKKKERGGGKDSIRNL